MKKNTDTPLSVILARDYLWILSRTPQMNYGTYGEILSKISKQGYDLDRIKKYPQVAFDKKYDKEHGR